MISSTPTKLCPLCNKPLLELTDKLGIVTDYICQTRISFNKFASLPHYEDREYTSGIIWYCPPYRIININNQSIIDEIKVAKYQKPEFIHVFVTSQIHPDVPEKISNRIKNLIMFS